MNPKLGKISVKDEVLSDIQNSEPDTIELVYYFLQTLKKSRNNIEIQNMSNPKTFAGKIDSVSGELMKQVIENEFNKIEGEW